MPSVLVGPSVTKMMPKTKPELSKSWFLTLLAHKELTAMDLTALSCPPLLLLAPPPMETLLEEQLTQPTFYSPFPPPNSIAKSSSTFSSTLPLPNSPAETFLDLPSKSLLDVMPSHSALPLEKSLCSMNLPPTPPTQPQTSPHLPSTVPSKETGSSFSKPPPTPAVIASPFPSKLFPAISLANTPTLTEIALLPP